MKKVLAAVGCGLVAVCLALTGCSNFSTDYSSLIEDFYKEYPDLRGSLSESYDSLDDYYADVTQVLDEYYASLANDGSSVTGIQTVYDYEVDGLGNPVADDNGNYTNHRTDYDSIFDYNSGYEAAVPEPSGQPATLAYCIPEGFNFNADKWGESSYNYDFDTGEGESIEISQAEDFDLSSAEITYNVKTGDTVVAPTIAYCDRSYNGYSLGGWMILDASGNITSTAEPGSTLSISASGILCPYFGSSASELRSWTTDYDFYYSGAYGSGTPTKGDGTEIEYSAPYFDTGTFRFGNTITATADYWFRANNTAFSIASSTDYTAMLELTNLGDTATSFNVGMVQSGGSGYTYNSMTWFPVNVTTVDEETGETTTTTANYKEVDLEPGETKTVELSFNSGSNTNSQIMVGFMTTGTSWLDEDGYLKLDMKFTFGETASTVEGGEAVTVNLDIPSQITLSSSYETPDYLETGDILTTSMLPSSSELTIPTGSAFGTRTLQGWYVKQTNEDGSISNSIISTSSGYTITSTEITIAPYFDYPLSMQMLYFNSASGNNLNVENVSGMTDVHSKYSVSSLNSYTTVIDALDTTVDSAFNYAVPATILTGTSVSEGDQFRCATSASNNIGENDNIVFYEFQNMGTEACYFKVYLTNSVMVQDTSYMYIYLNPGETVIFFVSLELDSGSNTSTNNSLLVFTAEAAASSLRLAVANGLLSGSDTSTHGGDFSYTDLLNQGFKLYSGRLENATEGTYSSATYSEKDFIAYITNSTKGSLNSAADVYQISGTFSSTASLVVSYDLDDAYVSLDKND
ncbi:MAG: hypothetical protein LUD50_00455 [Clostridia bacterium]|nr:hypothetical protein [Clostridia bacterium]